MGNGYFQRMDHARSGEMVGPPRQLSETPSAVQGAPPEIGQHNEEILLSVGCGWPQIATLNDQNAI